MKAVPSITANRNTTLIATVAIYTTGSRIERQPLKSLAAAVPIQTPNNDRITAIKPKVGWQMIDFKELREYRDLIFFLVWRDIKVLYAQTILGFSWAILQPLIQIVIFTVVFGKVANVPTDGIPYFLFSSAAVIPWTYMSQSMFTSSQSLVQGQNMLGKIYFPRLIFPITPVFSR